MKKIGFIGIGVMGCAMASNLMKKGYELTVYTRTKQKAEVLLEKGAKWCDTAADCAKGQDAVITMVGFPNDVEEVYFGESGIFSAAEEGTYLIDDNNQPQTVCEDLQRSKGKKNARIGCACQRRRYWCKKWYFVNYGWRRSGSL